MKYIVSGPALDKVLRENRIRIARGEIKFTPFVEAAPMVDDTKPPFVEAAPMVDDTKTPFVEAAPMVDDTKTPEVDDTKEVAVTDTKKPVKKSKK